MVNIVRKRTKKKKKCTCAVPLACRKTTPLQNLLGHFYAKVKQIQAKDPNLLKSHPVRMAWTSPPFVAILDALYLFVTRMVPIPDGCYDDPYRAALRYSEIRKFLFLG